MRLFRNLRKQKRKLAIVLLAIFLFELGIPTASYALTGGPSQPEVQSFQPAGVSDLVDPFTGDFSYNIPLMDVDGYPLNLGYQSGSGMDDEASWVGLGWNLNPGCINRNMRGIPDDFKGDPIIKEFYAKPNRTYGVSGTLSGEIAGLELPGDASATIGGGITVTYNNYSGYSFEQSLSPGISSGDKAKVPLTASLGFSASARDGLTITPQVGVSFFPDARNSLGLNIASSFNSKTGLKELSYNLSYSRTKTKTGFYLMNMGMLGYALLSNSVSAKSSMGISSGGFSFGMPSYTPQVTMPFKTSTFTYTPKAGAAIFLTDVLIGGSGFYSEQKLRTEQIVSNAYGYMNSQYGQDNLSAIHDFNREKDAAYDPKKTANLPLTVHTYDQFSVTGHGVGGSFRPYRSDIGYVFDPEMETSDQSLSAGVNAGAGNVIKVGVDVAATQIKTRSQAWLNQNAFAQKNKFKSQKVNDAFEPYYFKQQGELTVDYTPAQDNNDNDNLYQYTSSPIAVTGVNNTTVPELNPVSIKLNTSGKPFKGENKFKRYDFGSLKDETIDLQNKTLARTTRRKRSNNFTMLTVGEAKNSGMNTTLYDGMPEHHIGQITITKPDGTRYIYGLPVYNKKQVEVSFAVGKGISKNPILDDSDGDANNGIIQYPTGTDARNNGQGIDEHFNKVTTPGYAYAFMLTAIVSADYSDIDGVPGPSKGDMGTYTKFNYQKQNYNWRTPQGERTAYLDKGLITLEEDDRASYVYGEKELAYVASIESKNHKAEFQIETRLDALGVQEDGKVVSTNTKQYMLKSIKLYSTLMGESSKKLLKTVNFVYNYSLSGNLPNSIEDNSNNINLLKGKLTLKKVYFTYQNSNRAKFSPYTFEYSTNNPNYKAKAVDRWGNYYPGSTPDFPYSVQDATDANANSDAWQLTKIETPSGGEIEIDYEADTYAYVQNRKANQMFKVAGFYSDTNPPGSLRIVSNELYGNNWRNDSDPWVVVKLEGDAVTSINSLGDARTKLIGDLEKLYFRLNIMVNEKTGDPKYEYVPGYADISSSNNVGYFVDGGNKYVAVKVEKVNLKDRAENGKKLSPFVFSALQFSRLYTTKYVDGTPNATDGMQAIDVINLLLNSSFMSTIRETIQGPNKSMLSKGFCKQALLTDNARPSFVRLLNPTGKKYGGGSRVAKIMLRDSNVSGMPQDMAYGQVFDYNLQDGTSSGVAAYEPMLGADENPFRQPVSMSTDRQQRVLIPDDRFFQEEPFGESFFPSPVVGYSQVRIYSLAEGEESVPGKRDGFIQKEFYTAKDFPTVTARSAPVKPEQYARFRIIPRVLQYATVAQGYTVMLNDMHGKAKAEWVYGKGNNGPISGKEYKYHTHENSTPSNASLLKNTVDVIKPDGSVVTDARLGVETDIVVDVRQAETETEVIGANGNGEFTMAGIIPLATAIVLPRLKYEKVTFRSAVTTKVVYKYGLLSETIVHDNTARVKQQNLAYDAENSNVILSLTQNEYRDPIYSFTIPAHWAYEGMGGAYKNEGMVIDLGGGNAQGTYSLSSTVASKLHPGDELVKDGSDFRYYVIQKYGNTVIIGRQNGNSVSYLAGGGKLKIIRSGRRNMMMANVGQVISAKNPINTTTKKVEFTAANNIIDASAMEFSDNWQVYCNCFNKGQTVVPYYYGIKGNWRPLKSYHYLTNRRSENNRRVDGYFDNFSSYWVYSGGEWKTNATGWVWNTETTLYDPRSGAPMEEKDALMRYSTEYPRFNHSLTNAASKNTRRMELYYESFEDYKQEGEPCDELTEKFTNGGSNLDNKKSHTGRNSIKVTSTTPDTERKLKIRSCDLETVSPNN